MIQAEPNKTKFKFQILKIWQNKDASDKTELQIEVMPSDVQTDERFIKPGQVMDGFTFGNHQYLNPGKVLFAEGEYLGGPKHGKVHLTKLSLHTNIGQ